MALQHLDCRGLACPEPVIRCRGLLEATQPQNVCVVVDNAAANENVTRFLTRKGYTVASRHEESVWYVEGVLTGEPEQEGCTITEPAPKTSAQEKILVFITTETLGRGDETLGARLMENFLATLPELGERLWKIILLNGGVKLAAQEGKALESLKQLEQQGVSILVCGACLTFYDLLEGKAVGETTNMLDVVTSLDVADKVIRP